MSELDRAIFPELGDSPTMTRKSGPRCFKWLPDEIALHIFEFVDDFSLIINVRGVDRRFRRIMEDNHFWRKRREMRRTMATL